MYAACFAGAAVVRKLEHVLRTKHLLLLCSLSRYGVQKVFMSKLISALHNKHNALLEAPTGFGKTLCLLCGALAWQATLKKQAAQAVQELFAQSAVKSEQEGGPEQGVDQQAAAAAAAGPQPEGCKREQPAQEAPPQQQSKKKEGHAGVNKEPAASKKLKGGRKARKASNDAGGTSDGGSDGDKPMSEPSEHVGEPAGEDANDKLRAAMEKARIPTIFYATRTHSQISQVGRGCMQAHPADGSPILRPRTRALLKCTLSGCS